MVRNIAIFGSTGSIGKKVLEVVRLFPERFSVKMLGARRNIVELYKQVKEFNPKYVYIDDINGLNSLEFDKTKVLTGVEGVRSICSIDEIDTIVVAVDGYFGIYPTIEGIKNGKTVLTANKESIFIWGYEIMKTASKNNVEVIPLDSEHNTIFNLVSRVGKQNIDKFIITASGGPFLKKSKDEFENLTFQNAMEHPNWKMGKIVTINSATMFNKVLEFFEAHIFFEIPFDKIDIVIHPESRIHSMVVLVDGTTWSIYYKPDMIFPIANAMFFPDIPPLIERNISFEMPLEISLNFLKPDLSKFPILSLIKSLEHSKVQERAILNTSNEVCISLFERGIIRFNQIPLILEKCLREFQTDYTFEVSDNLAKEISEVRNSIEKFILNELD